MTVQAPPEPGAPTRELPVCGPEGHLPPAWWRKPTADPTTPPGAPGGSPGLAAQPGKDGPPPRDRVGGEGGTQRVSDPRPGESSPRFPRRREPGQHRVSVGNEVCLLLFLVLLGTGVRSAPSPPEVGSGQHTRDARAGCPGQHTWDRGLAAQGTRLGLPSWPPRDPGRLAGDWNRGPASTFLSLPLSVPGPLGATQTRLLLFRPGESLQDRGSPEGLAVGRGLLKGGSGERPGPREAVLCRLGGDSVDAHLVFYHSLLGGPSAASVRLVPTVHAPWSLSPHEGA